MEMKTFFLNTVSTKIPSKLLEIRFFLGQKHPCFTVDREHGLRKFTVEAETGRILIVTSPQI